MGEVLNVGECRLLAPQRSVTRLIAEIEAAPDANGRTGRRPLALAALKVAGFAIEAMADDLRWPLPEVAAIMGNVLVDLADSGSEDGSNTIWVLAAALAWVGSAHDYSHPDPDLALLRDAISEVV